jgi:hypothetical protein
LNRRAAPSLSYGIETARNVLAKQLFHHHDVSTSGTLHTYQQPGQQECGSPQMSRPPCLDIPLSSPLAEAHGTHACTLLPTTSSSKYFLSKVALNNLLGKRAGNLWLEMTVSEGFVSA